MEDQVCMSIYVPQKSGYVLQSECYHSKENLSHFLAISGILKIPKGDK